MASWFVTPCHSAGRLVARPECCECLSPRSLGILKVVLKLGAVGYEICHLLFQSFHSV